MKLENKVAWITGASAGIGEGLAKVFQKEGAELIISARRADELERVAATCNDGPAPVHVVPFDITDETQRLAAAESVLADFERVDILVNNAGIGQRGLAQDTILDVDRRIMEVDYFGPIGLTKLMLPRMIEQGGGNLIVTSSVAGKHAVPYSSAYCAAKHALHGFYDTLRVELIDANIDVLLLVIAGVKSEVAKYSLTADGSEFGRSNWDIAAGIEPEDCAEQVIDAMLRGDREVAIGIEQAMQSLRIRDSDPEGFIERMVAMKKWLDSGG